MDDDARAERLRRGAERYSGPDLRRAKPRIAKALPLRFPPDLLSAAMAARGMTCAAVAAELGVAKRTVQKWRNPESGKSPNRVHREALAALLK